MSEKATPKETGVIVIDHGSRRAKSNRMFLEMVALFEKSSPFEIVEPAHMDLAEPSLAAAFRRCVQRGARLVIIQPYFLLPGRHWESDIPELAAAAAQQHPGARFLVTAPIGLHPLMAEVINDRVRQCMERAFENGGGCELCENTDRCKIQSDETVPSK